MPTLESEGARHVAEQPLLRDSQIKFGVLADAEGFIEEADFLENGTAEHDRGRHDRPVVHEVITKVLRTFGMEATHRDNAAIHRVISGEIDEIAVDEPDARVACESGQLALEFLRSPEVIAVQERDELPFHLP